MASRYSMMSLGSESDSDSETETADVKKPGSEVKMEPGIKMEPDVQGSVVTGAPAVLQGLMIYTHLSGLITKNRMGIWRTKAQQLRWPWKFTDDPFAAKGADIFVVEDNVTISVLLNKISGWDELEKWVTVVKKEWLIDSFECKAIQDESSSQYVHALQIVRSREDETAQLTTIKKEDEEKKRKVEESSASASAAAAAAAAAAGGGKKQRAQQKGFLCELHPKHSKGDPNKAIQEEGLNEKLSNQSGLILKNIQVPNGIDNSNNFRQKHYTAWRDKLRDYSEPIYGLAEFEEFVNVSKLQRGSVYNHFLPIVRGEMEDSYKLQGLLGNDRARAKTELIGIWGVGPKTADNFIDKWGLKSLQECRDLIDSGAPHPFTPNHLVGIEHYEDFKERIPRDEVTQIEAIVRSVAYKLRPGCPRVMAVGSYRRGKTSCGDCDILITAAEGATDELTETFMLELINALSQAQFLTAHLTNPVGNREKGQFQSGASASGPNRDMASAVTRKRQGKGKSGSGRGSGSGSGSGVGSAAHLATIANMLGIPQDKVQRDGDDICWVTCTGDICRMNLQELIKDALQPTTTTGSSSSSASSQGREGGQWTDDRDERTFFGAGTSGSGSGGKTSGQRHKPKFSEAMMPTRAMYMGVCRVPASDANPKPKFRRIDMKLYPREKFPFALLYFTGSGHFNRSMRLWCDTMLKFHRPMERSDANGYSMSDLGLHEVTRDQNGEVGVKLTTIPAKNEREIFKLLHLPYRAPHQREHNWQSNYEIHAVLEYEYLNPVERYSRGGDEELAANVLDQEAGYRLGEGTYVKQDGTAWGEDDEDDEGGGGGGGEGKSKAAQPLQCVPSSASSSSSSASSSSSSSGGSSAHGLLSSGEALSERDRLLLGVDSDGTPLPETQAAAGAGAAVGAEIEDASSASASASATATASASATATASASAGEDWPEPPPGFWHARY